MPAVSVVTPAYNVERLIGETIDSVRRQTFDDWEMLVVDDGSTDGTREVVESVSRLDARVRMIRSPGNQGPALARQTAIDAATGRYLAFLDSDDLWLPEKLTRQLGFMTTKHAALSYTSFRRISEDGAAVGQEMPIPASLTYKQLLKNTAIATLTAIVDRDLTGPVRMTNEGYDDFCLWLSILRQGHVAFGLPQDLGRYRVRNGSVSSKTLRSALWVWKVYRNVERLSFAQSVWYLGNYGARAWLKRRKF